MSNIYEKYLDNMIKRDNEVYEFGELIEKTIEQYYKNNVVSAPTFYLPEHIIKKPELDILKRKLEGYGLKVEVWYDKFDGYRWRIF